MKSTVHRYIIDIEYNPPGFKPVTVLVHKPTTKYVEYKGVDHYLVEEHGKSLKACFGQVLKQIVDDQTS